MMGSALSSLGLGSSDSASSASSSYNSVLECCDGVVDPITLLSVLGAIIGLTIWLRQQVIDNVKKAVGRRKRKRSIESLPQANNLPQSQANESLPYQLHNLLVLLSPPILDEYNFYNVIITGRQIIMYFLCMEIYYG